MVAIKKCGPVHISCGLERRIRGSAAFNAFLERPEVIEKAVNICGRLRSGEHKWRSLKKMAATSEPFKQSVLLFEGRESEIPDALRTRMMTVSA